MRFEMTRTKETAGVGSSIFFRYWFPVVFYCAVLFVQSSFPSPKQIPSFCLSDKLLHFFAYAFLGMLFFRGFRHSAYGNRDRFIMVMSMVLTAFYGATDELHQYFVPERSAELADLIFDGLGGCFGVWLYERALRRYPGIGRI